MRAAQVTEFGQPLEVRDVERPTPARNEVLVEIKTCGVCHTDVAIRNGSLPAATSPVTQGHEAMGIVVERGEDVSNVNTGDRVCVNPFVTCGTCFYCQRGCENICAKWRQGSDGCGTIGRDRDGGFAEYLLIPGENAVHLPESISTAVGSILTDACATSFNSIQQADIAFDDTVAVFGAGGLGLSAIKYLSLLEHLTIVAVDLKPANLRTAERFGADVTIDATNEDHIAELQALTDGRGVDVAFEFAGAAAAMEAAVKSLRPNGTAIITGCAETDWEIPGGACCLDAININGSHGFTHQQLTVVIALVEAGKISFEDMISHRFPLESANQAIDYLEAPTEIDEEVRRIVLEVEQ